MVHINFKNSLHSFKTVRELAHSGIVDWVALHYCVLEGENLSVTLEYVLDVLVKKGDQPHFKLLVALDGVSVVLDRRVKFSMFHIHRFYAVVTFFLLKLVVHHFF